MPDEAKTLEEQIDEMIDETDTSEEVQDEEPAEVVEEDVSEETDGEPTGDAPEAGEEVEEPEEPISGKRSDEEKEQDEPKEVEEDEVGEEVDEISEFRTRMNQIAEAALRQGVALPAELLGLEEEPDTPKQPEVLKQPEVQRPSPQPQTPVSYEDFKILMDGVTFDDFMDNEETFTKGMRSLLSRHREMVAQEFMASIPQIIQNQVNQTTALQRAVDDFYSENRDLKEVRPTVGAVASQIQARHPDWDINKVLTESGNTTRKLLRMPSPSVAKKKKVNPSFAKPGGANQRNKPKQKASKLQMQIDELLED